MIGTTAATDRTGLAACALAPPSFRSVYDAYFEFVWSWARRLGVRSDALDDVVQDVFVVVHTRLRALKQPESLRSWLYGVVRRRVSDYHRARHILTAWWEPEVMPDDTRSLLPSPLEAAVLSDKLRLVGHLLGHLDPVKREVLELVELDEMTVPEIAQALGVPLNTAYSRLRAARQEFNLAVARYTAQQKTRE
jgi:RNA polymerase sigma-70 factor (ECF subfamily)